MVHFDKDIVKGSSVSLKGTWQTLQSKDFAPLIPSEAPCLFNEEKHGIK